VKKLGILTFCVILFLTLSMSGFGAKLVNYTYLPGEDEINFVFIYNEEPTEFEVQSLDYGRYFVVTTPGEMDEQNTIDRFLAYSPVVAFKASAGKGEIMYRFDMLLPTEPVVEIVANTLRITFKRNSQRIESFSSYTDSTQMGDRPSLIALLSVLREYMDFNLVIDEASLKGMEPVEFVMLSDNLRAEDFFLQIIMNNTKIGYAFLPNDTIYVVRKELLATKVEEILKETSISPQQETSYWSSYDFNINKKSTLYDQFTNQIDENTQLDFSVQGFEDYIQENFETYLRVKPGELESDMIALTKGNEDEEEFVPVGLLLYGDNNRHERFNFFIQFLEGISFSDGTNPADTGLESTQIYTRKISYKPLTEAEVREFMEFYLTFRTNMEVPKQELIADFDKVNYEISPLVSHVEIKGPVNSAKKLLAYLENYISNRKARGMEKIVELKIKDGYGAVFAIALRRLFPRAIVDADGININQLVNKPTFEWTYDDVKDFGKKDGNPDRVTLFGSNYEIITAEQIADDWDWLVPPLASEIRIISISEELPETVMAGLQNVESPNSLVSRFPEIEIDFSFTPLLFVKGKTHDLDIIEGYIKEVESVMLGSSGSYNVINVSTKFFESESLFTDLKGLIESKYTELEIIAYPSLNSILVKAQDEETAQKAIEEIKSLSKTESVNEISQYVDLERMSTEDVNMIYEQLFKDQGVDILYVQSRDMYKIYGPDVAVKAMVEELRKMDARRPDEDDGAYDKTELVNLLIPTLSASEVSQLVTLKVPGVKLEIFEGGGYFLTGTANEIIEAKDVLTSMSTEYMEESVVVKLAPGITFETLQNVLNLYYSIDEELSILDFGNSKVLLKGVKEKIENVQTILNGFGLLGENDDNFKKIVKKIDYEYIQDSGKIPPEELINIVNSYNPGVEIEYFQTASIFLLIGSSMEVENAVALINEYAEKIIVQKVWFGVEKENSYSESEMIDVIKSTVPGISKIEADSVNKEYIVTGDKESVLTAVNQMNRMIAEGKKDESSEPIVVFNEDGVHFDVNAQGEYVIQITKDISMGLSSQPKLFMPDETSTATSRINMNNLTWEEWLKITERLYDFNVDVAEGLREPIYIITPPGISHETGKNRKRTLNISHGYEEVTSLIQTAYGGTVYADETNGLVVFTGISDSDMESLKPLLMNTVEPKKMVEISAMVLDNSLIDKFNQDLSLNIGTASPTLTLNSENGFKFEGGILDFTDFSKLLNAVTQTVEIEMSYNSQKEDGKGEQMIRPYVTTMSGEAAQILIGTSYYYRLATTAADGSVQEQLITISSGYDLNITPTVNQDGTVFLDVNVGISSSDEYNPDGFPIQKTRNAVTKVLVNDTDTLVIGGLEGNISSNSVQKLPFIGDLPFVGQFFTTKIESEDKRNVSIFITPRIIEVKGTPEEIFGQNID
jgi:type II secretory pathway component GspD/PulD (secretin)